MPHDRHPLPKAEYSFAGTPLMRLLGSWNSRFVIPALANQAARAEIAGRQWLDETAPQRRRLAAQVAAQPVSALLAVAGLAYLAGRLSRTRR